MKAWIRFPNCAKLVDGEVYPLAVRYNSRAWAVMAEPVHRFIRDAWCDTRRTAAVGSGDMVSIEFWRVQVGLASNSALRTFTLRRDPLSSQWLLESMADGYQATVRLNWQSISDQTWEAIKAEFTVTPSGSLRGSRPVDLLDSGPQPLFRALETLGREQSPAANRSRSVGA